VLILACRIARVEYVNFQNWFYLYGTDPINKVHKIFSSRGFFKILANSFFSKNRITDEWNKLPNDAVTCPSINSLKAVDCYMQKWLM